MWDKCVVGLAEVGLNGEWLAVNPTLCDLLEYTESELQSRTFQQVTHPDDVNDDINMVERLKDGRLDHYFMTKRYITKRGRVIWIKLRVDPMIDEDGKVIYFLSQIIPASESGGARATDVSATQPRLGIRAFIAREWKWLVAAAVAIGGFAIQQYVQLTTMETRVSNLEKDIKSIVKILEERK